MSTAIPAAPLPSAKFSSRSEKARAVTRTFSSPSNQLRALEAVRPEVVVVSEDDAPPVSRAFRAAKRATDVVVAAAALVALAPLFAFVATLIKLTSRGPVFFAQWRVGKDAREFRFYKFRSMVSDADRKIAELRSWSDHQDSLTFKMKKDPRITRVGRVIRKLSIDELPQLWNVLRGDMSLVGPRPAVPGEVAHYTDHEWKRLAVAPGLTCLWQVGGRGDLAFDRQVALDLEYIRRRSWLLDLKLMLLTVPAVISGRGAY